MWTLFVVFFFCLIHTLQRYFGRFGVSKIWNSLVARNKDWHKGKLVVFECPAQGCLYCMLYDWLERVCIWEFVITAEEPPPSDSFQFSILFFFCFVYFFVRIISWCSLLLASSVALSVASPLIQLNDNTTSIEGRWGQFMCTCLLKD